MDNKRGYSISEAAFRLKIARVTLRGILVGLGITAQPGYSRSGRLALVITLAQFAAVRGRLNRGGD